jgi:Tfp pilus assembly protein PilP
MAKIIVFLILTSLLMACEKNDRLSQLKQQVASIRQKAEQNVKPLSVAYQLPAPIKYQGELLSDMSSSTVKPKVGSLHPLTDYPTSTFQFVGVIMKNKQAKGYVLGLDNIIYEVKIGDVLGSQKGKIIKITADHLEVKETYQTLGNFSKERIVMLRTKG